MMKISVVVPTRDRPQELGILLESLRRQTLPPDEVLVVDAGEQGRSEVRALASGSGQGLPLRHIRASPGANRQRNLGARLSSGDLVFFFDDDVAPARDFLEVMTKTFLSHPEYSGGMGTVAPVMRRWSLGTMLCRLFLLQHEFGDGRFSLSGMPRHPYGTAQFLDTEILDTGKMAVRRQVFTEDGIEFDERLTLSQQDSDFSRRLSRRRRLFYNPAARVDHSRSPHGRPGPYDQGRRYMFNYRFLYFKNFHPFSPSTLPLHWWALGGMFIVALLTGPRELLRGYIAGFFEFRAMQRGLSGGLFEPDPVRGVESQDPG